MKCKFERPMGGNLDFFLKNSLFCSICLSVLSLWLILVNIAVFVVFFLASHPKMKKKKLLFLNYFVLNADDNVAMTTITMSEQ